MESVGTHPDYRRQGLIRAQVERFHQVENERGFHFSAIGGIRYYYRRFGYTYVVDTENADVLPSRIIPEPPPDCPIRHRLRPATPDDAPALHRLYEQAMAPVHFHDQRSEEIWRHLLMPVSRPASVSISLMRPSRSYSRKDACEAYALWALLTPHTPTLRRPGRYKSPPTPLCGSSWASETSTS